MIHQGEAAVLPIYFAGQCSRLFQAASHISMDLRASLLFREAVKHIGGEVRAHIGSPIGYDQLARITDRRDLTEYLRQETLALSTAKGGMN